MVAHRVLNRAGVASGQVKLVVNGYVDGSDPSVGQITDAVGLEVAATLPGGSDPSTWTAGIDRLVAGLVNR